MSTFPVPVVFVYRRFSPSESATMSQKAVASELPGEDFSEQGTSSAISVVTDPSSIASPTPGTVIKSVWDCEKIEKRGGPDAFSKCWHCGWCGTTLKGWNATKALNHISKASGNNDVKPCSGAIPKATLALFKAMNYQKKGAASVKRQHKDAFAESISENQQSIAVMFEAGRSRTSNSSSAAAPIDMTGNCLEGTGVAAKNSTRLTSAIAEFIYSKGLSFSATKGEHFMQSLDSHVLFQACIVHPPASLSQTNSYRSAMTIGSPSTPMTWRLMQRFMAFHCLGMVLQCTECHL